MDYRRRRDIRALALSATALVAFLLAACNHRGAADTAARTGSAAKPAARVRPAVPDRPLDPPPPASDPQVLTYHNDVQRTGTNLQERILAPSNVNAAEFGKIAMLNVEGKVDAEPLYVSNLYIKGKKRNVVFIVTEHDLAYAFDADTFAPLWRVSLIPADETPSDKRDCEQVEPEIGVTATPVIDLSAGPHGTMYVVAMSKTAPGKYFQRLHALDIASGAERLPPASITAAYTLTDASGHHTRVLFDPKQF